MYEALTTNCAVIKEKEISELVRFSNTQKLLIIINLCDITNQCPIKSLVTYGKNLNCLPDNFFKFYSK